MEANIDNLGNVLELRDICKSYPDGIGKQKVIIENINIKVPDLPGTGQTLSLIGASGCGKTTILRIIAGLLDATSGDVLVHGKKITGPGVDRGMVFQNYCSFPWLSVLENAIYGMKLNGVPHTEAVPSGMEMLEKVGLSGCENLYPKNLSGGMQQRLAIARALLVKPKILLMDEPFGALDPLTRVEMQDLMVNLWKDSVLDVTIVFVTHDIPEALYLGNTVIVLGGHPAQVLESIVLPSPDLEQRIKMRKGEFADIEEHIIDLIKKKNGK